jgi:hypothetical protein
MRYKIMYVRKKKDGRHITVIDFKRGGQLTFTFDEFDLLDKDLQKYIAGIKEDIDKGRWEYTGPHT